MLLCITDKIRMRTTTAINREIYNPKLLIFNLFTHNYSANFTASGAEHMAAHFIQHISWQKNLHLTILRRKMLSKELCKRFWLQHINILSPFPIRHEVNRASIKRLIE
ncbi:hypothetical protein DFO68_104183 [Halomonas ventosae]|uniref:Uncharacterized protein n=1 Tax=Halomonas ventosae TaxID=229007 RepID=A0A4R6HTW2_9GAMM|nr:hypothetical protein DFO68_104183 [Halomonas ventosae]